jgi:hypothetical protein
MHKFSVLLWVTLYLATATGLPVTLHYCGDRVAHVSLLASIDDSPCRCKGGKMTKGCCSKITFDLDIEDKEVPSKHQFVKLNAPDMAIVQCTNGCHHLLLNEIVGLGYFPSPPAPPPSPLLTRLCIWRI